MNPLSLILLLALGQQPMQVTIDSSDPVTPQAWHYRMAGSLPSGYANCCNAKYCWHEDTPIGCESETGEWANGKWSCPDATPESCLSCENDKGQNIECPTSKEPSSNSGLGIVNGPTEKHIANYPVCYVLNVATGACISDEPIDVAPIEIEVEEWVPCASYASEGCKQLIGDGNGNVLAKRAMVKHRSCEDSRRIGPLPSADGKWHCLYFGGQ